jgi:hypothetical protein
MVPLLYTDLLDPTPPNRNFVFFDWYPLPVTFLCFYD